MSEPKTSPLSLPERLMDLPSFKRELRNLTLPSVAFQFVDSLRIDASILGLPIDSDHLLRCASILARSRAGRCQDAALRICQFTLTYADDPTQLAAAGTILDSMTNGAAERLAIKRNLLAEEYWRALPGPLQLDRLRRHAEFTILDHENDTLEVLNRFQLEAYRAAQQARWVSLSAPTSSGKSFVLLRIVLMALTELRATPIVYVAPTRALIQQVEADLNDLLTDRRLDVFVSSVPRMQDPDDLRPAVYVFTQERLHWLLSDSGSFAPSVLIVDEAQRIGDEGRGILLEQVISNIIRRSPSTRILFSSPLSANPELLLDGAPPDVAMKPVPSDQIVVNQNLIFLEQVRNRPLVWQMSYIVGDETELLGTVHLPKKAVKDVERLPYVAHQLAGSELGNLLYADRPSGAEKFALILLELEGGETDDVDPEIAELVKLTKDSIHESYDLAKTLSRGVAFHYGNMPLLIRNEIEKLFKSGKIRFLICTPTLIEGVNLPAKTIYIRNPHKGIGTPMNEIDFWNLAGRAGRQGKEFQGNVVCVDPKKWQKPVPRRRGTYSMQRRVDLIAGRARDLFAHMSGPPSQESDSELDDLDYAFVFFLTEHINHDGFSASPTASRYSAPFADHISALCRATLARAKIPGTIIMRNPGVNPYRLHALLERFKSEGDLSDLVPLAPRHPEARRRFEKIILVISEHLDPKSPAQLAYPRSILVTSWLRGYPLARIIRENWKYWEKHNGKLPSVIRNTMTGVEEYVRFRFAKYLGCYTDLLKVAFEERGEKDKIADVLDLQLNLEFGAATDTQLSLMSLGLSRTSALAVAALEEAEDLTPQQCRALLRSLLDDERLSPIIRTEVGRVLLGR